MPINNEYIHCHSRVTSGARQSWDCYSSQDSGKQNLVIEGHHDPTTVQHLSAIRLSEEYWQSLVDTDVISLEVPTEITLKPRSPTAEKEIAEPHNKQTVKKKKENMLDKSL